MCGIAGQVSWRRPCDPDAIGQVVQRLGHRGPDDSGVHLTADGRCALGHARLSVLDLSAAGHQPMSDLRTGSTITFNGEIYNHHQLRRECEAAGDTFHSRTDTEVVLALYRRYGIGMISRLRGMFAFAIWDPIVEALFLVRDRVGKKPLNFVLAEDGIVFASEIDPLSRYPGVSRELDAEALELYLQLQFIPAPWSVYRSIRKLEPGHFAKYSRHGLEVHRYWEVDYRKKVEVSLNGAIEALDNEVREAVAIRAVSDVPVGALLSGGVDSSVIVAILAQYQATPVQTFTIGFDEQTVNEVPHAERVAKLLGTQHTTEVVSTDIGQILADMVRYYGEPFADPSAIPSFIVSRVARRSVTVALTGDGGDELLGGYQRYALHRVARLVGQLIRRGGGAEPAVSFLEGLERAKTLSERLRRKWILRVAYPELQSFIHYAPFWNDRERRGLFGSETGLLTNWKKQWLDRSSRFADDPIDRMLWLDNHTYLPGDLLVKMDIASMHVGLEARSPLLDHQVIEYCASLPVRYKVHRGVGKYLLKRLAERYLPVDLVYRRKQGFAVPLDGWLRGEIRRLAEDVLFDERLMEPFDLGVVRSTWLEFVERRGANASRIYSLLIYGIWRRYVLHG